jgi:3-oxoacyl-[acyl-carrier protein] reductase
MDELRGKNAWVGGGSKGIGKATAVVLSQMGANVTIVARSQEALQSAVDELPAKDAQQHHWISVDYSNPEELKEIARQWLERRNAHILINNTGGPPAGPIEDAAVEEFSRAFNNHLICNHLLTQLMTPGMKKDGYGRIVNIISTSVKQPLTGLGVSNTVRGAVANWSKTMANELGPMGITVNNVLPGATNTDRLKSIIAKKAEKQNNSFEAVAENMKQSIPLRRFAEPEEVAHAIAFLCSPRAAYISGINLPVDGGRTKCL